MKIHWTQCLTLTALLAFGFVTVAFPQPSPQHRLLEMPFDLYRDYIIVAKGSIGEKRNRNLLIDTGAVPSVVDARLAKKLKLKGRESHLSLFTKRVKVKSVVLPSLELGPIRLTDHPVMIQDLRFIERGIGVRIDAIIGLDVLGWSNLMIDYGTRRLHFGVRVSDEPKIPLELGPGCMLLAVRIEGRTLRLMVDTGASGLMLFETRFRTLFPNLRPRRKREFENMGGAKSLAEVELRGLEIGTARLGPTMAALITSEANATPDFDGLLGIRGLGASRVYFDFNEQVMTWSGAEARKLVAER